MAKAVLLHKSDSIYDDEPDRVYDFPRAYLAMMQAAVGDWVVYYEPVKAGPRGYFATARIAQIIDKPGEPGRHLALIAPGSFLPFDRELPRLADGRPRERRLADAEGWPAKGGQVQRAVRPLDEDEFAAIIDAALPADLETREARRYGPAGFDDAAAPFARPVIERLTQRPYRDAVFRRKVLAAYDERCAISGLRLTNGGGRPEVQAAHIRPVEHHGGDRVGNGLALSATLHWMFDRGLIAVAEDHRILVSHNKVDADTRARLFRPDMRLALPADRKNHPHPVNLAWRREHVFGQAA